MTAAAIHDDPHAPLPPTRVPLLAAERDRAMVLLGERAKGAEFHERKVAELAAIVGRYPSPRIAARWKAWLKHRWPAWLAARAS